MEKRDSIFITTMPQEMSRDAFAAHLALGSQLDLPVVVHARAPTGISQKPSIYATWNIRGVSLFTGGALAFQEAF
ncbi:MAG: hypothetical protein CM1200mP14_26650 [Gammaproteobacteria bacterium]|nr:MAG: hypothetical protein CM1200mP14_26650 [Gammaproteobacteria bacterium]